MKAEHWPRVKVSELCELIVDCINKTAPRVERVTPYKMIRTPNIKKGKIDLAGCRYVEKETYEKWTRRATVNKGDVLLTREAPMGEAGLVNFEDTVFLGQRIMQYRVNPKKLDPNYLLYAFLSPDLQFQFRKHDSTGSTVSHIRVPDCSEFEINTPPLSVQKQISKVLRDIDDKIERNNRINAELEAMAKTLYDYWFVQFDFPDANGNPYKASGGKMVYDPVLKREIPVGWSLVPLEYFADVIDPHPSHRAPKEVEHGFPFAGIGDIDESGNIAISKARKIDEEFVEKQERDYAIGDYSLGYGRVGTVGKVVRLKKQKFRYALSPTLSVINPKKPEYAGYIYTVIKSEEFYKNVLKNTSGTTRPAIGIQLLRKIPMLKPRNEHADMFERYEKITRELFEKTSIANQESQELIELRDWLLPMLMNGQVTVKPSTEAQEDQHG